MSDQAKKPHYLDEINNFYRGKLHSQVERHSHQQKYDDYTPPLAPDYETDMFARLPPGMAQTSFGCGNPIAFSGVNAGDVVLDLGSGAGLDLLVAAEKTGPQGRVVGVDMSEEMTALAKENTAKAGFGNIEVRNGIIEDLPVETASIDWVISNCVVNLSLDKPAVFGEIYRVLKPGGRMLISDLVADDLPEWVNANKDLYAACISGALSEASYLATATQVGMQDVAVVNRLIYGEAEVRSLICEELPVALSSLAERFGTSLAETTDFVARELTGRVQSIKVYAQKPTV